MPSEGSLADRGFFADLPGLSRFADVMNVELYRPAPEDWDVVVTDVQGSTKAIEAGRYKDVNALGVASIVALRNAVKGKDLPFVFGGDGATALVPAAKRERVERALRGVRRMAKDSFQLGLRVGLVPVRTLREAGHPILVARLQVSEQVSLAMFAGSGPSEAERRVKDPETGHQWAVDDSEDAAADFDGFECRWKPIPNRRGQVMSLLVQATAHDRSDAASTYRKVLERIQRALTEDEGRPVSIDTLQLGTGGGSFDQEARIKAGRATGLGYLMKRTMARMETTVGRMLFATGGRAFGFDGRSYRGEVAANTDFRKFDDTLRMVLDVTNEQRETIEKALADAHQEGQIVYGTHIAAATLMTCVIESYDGDHMHFVDGADGGYALAAKQLKKQLAARVRSPG